VEEAVDLLLRLSSADLAAVPRYDVGVGGEVADAQFVDLVE
jgi:hypothetical protein